MSAAVAASVAAAAALLILSPGCGASDVSLRASTPDGGAGPGGMPAKPTVPGELPGDPGFPPGPAPGPAPAKRFWVFCGINSYSEVTSAYDLTIMSASLGPLEHGTSVTLVDPSFPADRPIQALDKNVDSIMALPASHVAPFTYRTLFLGRRSFSGQGWGLWTADVNVAKRSGRARPIGPGMQPSGGVAAAAQSLGGQTRKFGASDQGTYLFLPAGVGSFSVLRAVDFSAVGRIDVGGDALMPQMDEESGVFWAWTSGPGGMTNRFYSVRDGGGRLQIVPLGSFGAGPQTPAQRLGQGEFAWAETPGAGTGVIPAMTAVLARPMERTSSRFAIEDERGPGFFRPMAAAYRMASGVPAMVVAEEDIDRRAFPWRLRRGEVRVYRLERTGPPGGPAVRATLDGVSALPAVAVEEIEKRNPLDLRYSNFALAGGWNLPDGSQAVLTMETKFGPFNFRALSFGGGAARVDGMGDEVCKFPASIANPD